MEEGVRESAQAITPPSYFTAMMVVPIVSFP
jgi:hypothetical protein